MWDFFLGIGLLSTTIVLTVSYLQEEVELQERLEQEHEKAGVSLSE